jgi:hypothetical protein
MIPGKIIYSTVLSDSHFSANYKISHCHNKTRGVTMLLLLITLISTTFCSNVTLYDNKESVLDFYSSPGFYSYKTASHIIILQVNISDERIKPNLKDVDYITFSEDQILLWVNEESIKVSVSNDDNVAFQVDGIILFTNKNIPLGDVSSIMSKMSDKSDLNCWAGGAGAKSCTTRYGASEVKTMCRDGLSPCCTREITGICTAD